VINNLAIELLKRNKALAQKLSEFLQTPMEPTNALMGDLKKGF